MKGGFDIKSQISNLKSNLKSQISNLKSIDVGRSHLRYQAGAWSNQKSKISNQKSKIKNLQSPI
jgi:hypothetical protein